MDRIVEVGGVRTENGLVAIVGAPGNSSAEALTAAEAAVNQVAEVLCLSTSVFIETPSLETCIEATPDVETREMIQRIPYRMASGPRRKFDVRAFDIVWRKLDAHLAKGGSRLHQAVGWHRKALLESNVFDQFMNVWTGLEVLNGPAKAKYGLPKERPLRVCEDCGHPVEMIPTNDGIRYIVEHLAGAPASVFRRAGRIRVELVHGVGDLGSLASGAGELLPLLRRALVVGILDMIDVPRDQLPALLREPFMSGPGPYIEILASLTGLTTEDILTKGLFPHFESLEPESLLRLSSEHGKTSETHRARLRFVGCGSAKATVHSIRVVAPVDPEDGAVHTSVEVGLLDSGQRVDDGVSKGS